MKCLKCENEIGIDWRKDRQYAKKFPLQYCSRACANSKVHSEETKSKVSATLKAGNQQGLYTPRSECAKPSYSWAKVSKLQSCTWCGTEFTSVRTVSGAWKRICCDSCYIASKKKNAGGNKSTIYNGIRFDSNWEVQMVKFFEEYNIDYTIPTESVPWIDSNGKAHKYFPDFYLPALDLYVDPKNPIVIIKQKEKLEAVSKSITLIYGHPKDLQKQILGDGEGTRTPMRSINLSTGS